MMQKFDYKVDSLLFAISYFILALAVYFIVAMIVLKFFHGLKKVTSYFLLSFSGVFGILPTGIVATLGFWMIYKTNRLYEIESLHGFLSFVTDNLESLGGFFTLMLETYMTFTFYSLFTGFCILGVHKLFTRHKENKQKMK